MDEHGAVDLKLGELAFQDAFRRWSLGLAASAFGPAGVSPGEWLSLPAGDWLAVADGWALGAIKVTWRDGTRQVLVGLPRNDLQKMSGSGETAEGQPDPAASLMESLLQAGSVALAGLRTTGGGVDCEVAWSRFTWELPEIGELLGGDALAGEVHVCTCAVSPEGRELKLALNLGLPLDLMGALAPLAPLAPPAPPPTAKAPVIAVLAFDPKIRRELRDAAKGVDPEVAEFVDVRDYLQSRLVRRTRLILLAVSLENRTALEHCKALRQEPKLKDVPVLMCAPTATRDLLVQALAAGARGFAVAPFSTTIPVQLNRLLEAA